MPLGHGTKIAGYTIQRLLGSGGMGEVYLARHPRLPREDAIKVLRSDISADADFQERFNREADLAAKLWHPHIVGIHDRGKHIGRLWISMDFVDGPDVGRLLQERYPNGMPLNEAIQIIKATASALDYAHARGLLHRDVKPANIVITDADQGERRVLLTDFGVARELAEDGGGLTATNMTIGTAAYAAPEQLMGEPVDARTDQYALAATAYHLVTGAPPFQHTNPAVVIGKHLNAPPPALVHTRRELAHLDAALAKALAKNPSDRFALCMDFARALDDSGQAPTHNQADTMLAIPTVTAGSATVDEPHRTTSRRPVAWLAVAATAVVIAVALAVYLALAPTGEQKPSNAPFTLAGTVRLSGDVNEGSGLPAGYSCVGAHDFGDVGPNAPVTIEDESGKLLAKGAIEGSSSGRDGCVLRFRVKDVPTGAQFYRVHVSQHAETSYTEAEAKAGVDLTMGNAEPTPTTASAAPSTRTPPPSSAPTRTAVIPPDAEQLALKRLQALANQDRSDVNNYMSDIWIPQISSKRVGLYAQGITWNNQSILAEHLRLRSTYPNVKLLWSGDWSTYDGQNFWVTVVGLKSTDPDEVLAWCTQEGFDRDNCIAKMVSTWHPIAGSTRMN